MSCHLTGFIVPSTRPIKHNNFIVIHLKVIPCIDFQCIQYNVYTYTQNVKCKLLDHSIPFSCLERSRSLSNDPFFSTFAQVLFGISISWLICYILTITNVFPSSPNTYGYLARTDVKGNVLDRAPWFRFPYPGIMSNTESC